MDRPPYAIKNVTEIPRESREPLAAIDHTEFAIVEVE